MIKIHVSLSVAIATPNAINSCFDSWQYQPLLINCRVQWYNFIIKRRRWTADLTLNEKSKKPHGQHLILMIQTFLSVSVANALLMR